VSIISQNESKNHNIQKYTFVSLDNTQEIIQESVEEEKEELNIEVEHKVDTSNSSIQVQDDKKIQDLLAKIDELSSNVDTTGCK